MGHQMLLTEFYSDRPLLPWQQNLRQNGLYLGLYNKYHQDPCIWRMWGLRVLQLDDVNRSLSQPTLISRYNEQQRCRSSSSSRHIQRSVPDRRYTVLPDQQMLSRWCWSIAGNDKAINRRMSEWRLRSVSPGLLLLFRTSIRYLSDMFAAPNWSFKMPVNFFSESVTTDPYVRFPSPVLHVDMQAALYGSIYCIRRSF